MTIEYSLFEKRRLSTLDELESLRWDVFLSGYSEEQRVREVFARVHATDKRWLGLPEYGIRPEYRPAECISWDGDGEALLIPAIGDAGVALEPSTRICIDSTGILRQYLLVLVRALGRRGVRSFDVVYSEPSRYGQREQTRFSGEELIEVRQVQGFEGSHIPDTTNDLIVIATGYEDRLVAAVAEAKNHAEKRLVYAFPSLQADMYQESALATFQAQESIGRSASGPRFFAPAQDPFATASRLRELVAGFEAKRGLSNLYLAPLATKPMALGFALYFIWERSETETSILMPLVRRYSPRSSRGLKRIWLYRIELPQLGS